MYRRRKVELNRIKGALADTGVSNNELAKALGVHPSTVSTWCTNDRQPPLATLYDIAAFLNIDVRDLLAPNKPLPSSHKK
jgi:transcriptional regulator with XRE-family HTH domain